MHFCGEKLHSYGVTVNTGRHQSLLLSLVYPLCVHNADIVYAGKDDSGFGYGGTGKKSFSSQFDSYGEVNM